MELCIPEGSLGGTTFFMGHTYRVTHAVRRMQQPDAQAKKRDKTLELWD
jgi:hypothetical protein